MQIKKHTKQSETPTSLTHRLSAYSRQAKQYQGNSGHTQSFLPDWKKTTLAALIPLAAASAAQAQCNGALPAALVSSAVGGNPSLFSFDVDGVAGNDLKIRVVSAAYDWFIAPVNAQFYIGLSGGGRAAGVGASVLVTRGQAFGNGSRAMCAGGGAGNFCVSSPNTITKSIPIRKGDTTTGQPGWITLQVTNNYPVVTVTVLQRGVESLTNSSLNSAITGDCSSIANGAPLPVEMTRFTAEPHEKYIVLDWTTANELHNSGFEVQRGTDGRSFSKIGWLEGSGTTAIGKEYAFTDDEVQPNTLYYYRLRQLDHNGTENFTPVRSAMVKDNSRLTVEQLFPNPVKSRGAANFHANAPQEGELDIQLFDARGSLVQQLSQSVAAGANTFSLPMSEVVAGIYFIKMQLGKDVTYQRLVVN